MTVIDLLAELRRLDVNLRVDGDRLRFDAPPGAMTDQLRTTLKDRKDEILDWMRGATAAGTDEDVIPHVGGEGPRPVSFAQRRMWFLQQMAPDSSAYNMAGAVRLEGVLDQSALEHALAEVQRRHEVLRTRFELRGDEPVQIVCEQMALMLPSVDLSDLPEDARRAEFDQIAAAWSREPFDLAAGPLFRVRLARLAADEHALMLAFHHSVCDGWSIGVFVQELGELYAARVETRAPVLAALPVQYGDFAAWQRERLTGDVVERDLAYWRRQLDGAAPTLELWADRARPDVPSFTGALHQFVVPATSADALERVAGRSGATLFMTLLAAFNVLLFRLSGQRDIVVGSPIAGRNRPELEPLLGCFVNTLALRTVLDGGLSFEHVVARVRDVCLGAFEHQDVPFERIVEDLRLDRQSGQNPLYQVMFSLQSGGGQRLALPGLVVSPMEARATTARVDLTWAFSRSAAGLTGLVEYSTDLFDAATIDRMARTFVTLVGDLAVHPESPVGDAALTSPAELRAVVDAGRGATGPEPSHSSLGARLQAVVAQAPDAVAIEDGATRWTYAELGRRASQLAGVLQGHGVGPQIVVGVWQERGADLLGTIAGIAVAGGAYLPVEPTQPAARAATMFADAQTRVVVTTAALAATVPAGPWRVLTLEDAAQAPMMPVRTTGTAEDLAYVLFTSGSTGTPKGVAVPQTAVVRLVVGTDYVGLGPDSVMGQAATAAFDAATFEVWGAWLHGARLVVIPSAVAVAPQALGAYLQRTGVTTLFLTTALVHQIGREAPGALAGLDTLLFGGEAVEPRWVAAVQAAGGPRRVLHVYGPTENTTFSTWASVDAVGPGASTISIGGPIAQSSCWVVDAAGTLAGVGVPGELLVGGAGLAWGYLNNPRLTAERFVPDPYSGAAAARLYRTGDVVRWTAPGALRFVGRRDGQVKLRGHRIELNEVARALRAAPGVTDAVVVISGTGVDRRLVGYVAAASGEVLTGASVRAAVMAQLPRYMVPAVVVVLAALPLTANGKVDRRALPALEATEEAATPAAAPASALGHTIARVWAEVLGVATVGVHDNFFDLGGHSLLLVRVQAGLEAALGRAVPLVTLFQYPTVSALATHLRAEAGAAVADDVLSAPASASTTGRALDGPIAVIGFAGRFPGAPDVASLWAAVREGRELLHRFTAEELTAAGVPAALQADPRYIPVRGVLTAVEEFDAGLFGLVPREAALLDPQQRLLLECAWTALEHAGHGPQTRRAARIGVWAGTSANTYIGRINRATLIEAGALQVLLSSDKDFLATRVSYKLDLGGPAVTVQTACSTSLVAVHLACQALRAGECEVALAGGVSVTVPAGGYVYQPEGIASPDGHCRPFDAAAQGTVAGNGVGVVVLKPLSAAQRDGDAIYAVVRGSAINNDGADKVGFTAPSVHGQAAVVRAAQAAAGVSPESIGYVEAHGTATTLGDPIEVAALRQVWGSATVPCGLSSVKGVVGHLDAAAGVTGLLAAIQALQAGEVPATAHFTRPNPQLDLGSFFVTPTPTAWPRIAGPRRAGVSSFGIGGTNAHVVIEQAPAIDAVTVTAPAALTGALGAWQVVPVSGQNAAAVTAAATQLADALVADPTRALGDVAWTQQVGRAALGVRRVAIGTDGAMVAAALRTARDTVVTTRPPVVFVCPGQGTQVLRMGAALYATAPVFRAELDACAAVVQPLLGGDLRVILYPEASAETDAAVQLGTTAWTQVALVAVALALAAQWRAWGIAPDAVVGHSVGEVAAACMAGVLTREAALTLAATRGQAMNAAPAGGMLAVLADVMTVTPHLGEDLWLAALNRPNQVVVAGAEPALARAEGAFEAAGIATQRLEAAGAFHSGLMAGAVAPLDAVAQALPHAAPRLPWISTVTGAAISADDAAAGTTCDAMYWGRQVLAPVQWAAAVQTAASIVGEPAVWLELGPGTTLTRLIRGTVPVAATVPSLDGPDAAASVAQALGALWTAGVTPAWAAVHAPATPRRIPLPTYPFQRQRYWLEAVASDQDGQDVSKLFVKKSAVDDWFYRPSWRQAVPLAVPSADLPSQRWVVFADTTGLADHLSVRLVRAGQQVIVVEPGDRYDVMVDVAAQPTRFVIRPDVSADYDAMFDRLDMARAGVVTIVHAWSLGPSRQADGDRLGMEQVARARGFSSVRLLARALGRVPLERVRVNVVSTGVYAVTGDEDLVAVNATVVGPVRAMGAEIPRVSSRHIDVTWPTEPAARRAATERLVAELTDVDGPAVVAHRGAHRWVPSFEPVVAQSEDVGASRLRQRGVYVITGGLGGVGLVLAEVLARLVQARLVLVGRSGLPAHRQEAVRALEALGADVMVMAADVASPDAMRSVFEQARARFGAINGVIHAAGVAGDGMMAIKNADAAGAVLAPKVTGTIVLDDLLGAERPDFVVLCSSLAAFLGGAGQADYCAANAFLDAYAQRRWCLGDDTVTSINWDTWRDGGMAVDTPVPGDVEWRKALALESGITNDEGQAVFLRALGMRLPQVVVCTKDLPRLVDAMAHPVGAGARPKDVATAVSHPRPALTTRFVAPERDSERQVCAAFERALGVAGIGVHDNFFELGGHSLLAVDLMAQLNRQFDANVPVAGLYEGLTPGAVAQLFDGQAASGPRQDIGAGRRKDRTRRQPDPRVRESRIERRQRG